MKEAVMFGAGNIGRGFIAQLFSQSGYRVTFVDVDQPLLDALNARGEYTIVKVDNDLAQQVHVGPVRAVHADDRDAVIQAVAEASIMATAVGARALPFVAPNIAAGVRRRFKLGRERALNCIVCENLKGAASFLRGMVRERLDLAEQAYMDRQVGFVDTVIGRMVPPLTAEMREQDPSLIRVEPYQELPVDRAGFAGPIPEIASMQPCDHFEVYTARKLYVHNCGHAVLAYLGYIKGYTYGYEALADGEIAAILHAAWEESIAGQVTQYGVEPGWLREHARDLERRFANRALGDTVFRLGRDPIRKLRPTDRLVSPARLAERAGRRPAALAQVIAAALCFDPADDPVAQEMQARLRQSGLDAVLAEVCEIEPGEPLSAAIRQELAKLGRQ